MPEVLANTNCLFQGFNETGERDKQPVLTDSVILPKWCVGHHDFVRINREALESEYVK